MDATATASTLPTIEQTFTVAVELVTAAMGSGIVPTAATLKQELRSAIAGFDENAYGFKKFLSYLQAAEAAGHVTVSRDEGGHPRISLPSSAAMIPASSNLSPQRRLRPDLWTTVVSWDDQCARYWDRTRRRALLVPLDEGGRPLWETETDRFVAIDPVPMDVALGWMRDFVAHLDEGQARADLDSALGTHAGARSFKSALSKHHLTGQWQAVLSTCVMNHTIRWANDRGVSIGTITESGARRFRQLETAETPPAMPTSTRRTTTRGASSDSTDELQALRARLHSVIDQMAYSELARIQVPAAYLVRR